MSEETQAEFEELLGNKNPIDRIKELAENYNETCYEIGCILYHMKENDIYKTINGKVYYSDKHTKWKQFCEDNLSISYRTAQYWLNLYRYFIVEMGLSKETLRELGWSKAKELIDITDDPDVLYQFVQQAKDMTIAELQASIASYEITVGEDKREVVKFKSFNFRLPMAQSEHAAEIMNIAAAQCNGDMNEGFFKVVLEWYQANHPVSEEDENTFLVSDRTLDDNGQELPQEILDLI